MNPWRGKKSVLGFGKSDKEFQRRVEDHQRSQSRASNHVMVVLVGASGVGKTSTIKHLIGQNDDMEFPTSDNSSETRSTIEYLLRMRTKDPDDDVNHISLGIVDTPGANDLSLIHI